jgi:hypothetical protein
MTVGYLYEGLGYTKPLPQYDPITPAQSGTGTGTGVSIVTFPLRWVYPSQMKKLQAAGIKGALKQGESGVRPADRYGYVGQGEYGYTVKFSDQADLAAAQATGATMFSSRPHGDANWWILNIDIGTLEAAGAPYTVTQKGRAFTKVLLHEYELWRSLYDGLAVHIQQKYKIDPNTFVDPNISLPTTMPTATPAIPATPEAVVTAPAAQAATAASLPPITLPYAGETMPAVVQAAVQPAAPVVYYPTEEAAADVPGLAPVAAATTAPATTGGGAAAGLSIGMLLLMLMRR